MTLRSLSPWLILVAGCAQPTIGGPCEAFSVSGSPGEMCTQQFYFPTGIAIDPAADTLYVSNANADLRYAGGSVLAVDLNAFDCAVAFTRAGLPADGTPVPECDAYPYLKCAMRSLRGGVPDRSVVPDASCTAEDRQRLQTSFFFGDNLARIQNHGLCRPALTDPSILECDEQLLIAGGVRVGNFAGEVRVRGGQPRSNLPQVCTPGAPLPAGAPAGAYCGPGGVVLSPLDLGKDPQSNARISRRLFVAVRGDPSVTWIDVSRTAGGTRLLCADQPADGLADACTGQRITVRDFNPRPYHGAPGSLCSTSNQSACVFIPGEPFGLALDQGFRTSACPASGASCRPGSLCSDGSVCQSSPGGVCSISGAPCMLACADGTACGADHLCGDGQTPCGRPCADGSACRSDNLCAGDGKTPCYQPCQDGSACVVAGSPYERLLVSHLSGGEVTLIDAAIAAPTSTLDSRQPPLDPVVLDVRAGFFNANGAGLRGGFALAPQTPGDGRSLWYLTSRVNPTVAEFRIADANTILNAGAFGLGLSAGGPYNLGDDVRGVVFDPCAWQGGTPGCRGFFLDNHPPSVFTLDTRIDPSRVPAGVPLNTVAGIVPVCQGPSHLAFRSLSPSPTAPENRVFVLCYDAGQLAVVDPDLGQLVDTTLIGRGPNEIAFNLGPDLAAPFPAAPPRAYVTNFLDHTVSVIDLEPGSPTQNHVISRIGFTEPPVVQ